MRVDVGRQALVKVLESKLEAARQASNFEAVASCQDDLVQLDRAKGDTLHELYHGQKARVKELVWQHKEQAAQLDPDFLKARDSMRETLDTAARLAVRSLTPDMPTAVALTVMDNITQEKILKLDYAGAEDNDAQRRLLGGPRQERFDVLDFLQQAGGRARGETFEAIYADARRISTGIAGRLSRAMDKLRFGSVGLGAAVGLLLGFPGVGVMVGLSSLDLSNRARVRLAEQRMKQIPQTTHDIREYLSPYAVGPG
ncbi:MAG: hypothetical protein HY319_24700 [Armatimonadetes bacterium]|nr:hypothetical protein [Armatimonadota bacterium]